ncbi:protein of unknown function [Methylotuvimicrobium alcaliphilum 20Z]|uniref:Uncharacterized protein n=1 Tax=Methylotuvimicrobium alcaliphilum (strain DSM 19304 / NCIMB 14124 / VKM B-2133 / 20Z) TaxID=1091494 RepID=G4SUV3_META2|nr:protein of unknown function [Methylotuvimicrobium alcaliphilum 20Z]
MFSLVLGGSLLLAVSMHKETLLSYVYNARLSNTLSVRNLLSYIFRTSNFGSA